MNGRPSPWCQLRRSKNPTARVQCPTCAAESEWRCSVGAAGATRRNFHKVQVPRRRHGAPPAAPVSSSFADAHSLTFFQDNPQGGQASMPDLVTLLVRLIIAKAKAKPFVLKIRANRVNHLFKRIKAAGNKLFSGFPRTRGDRPTSLLYSASAPSVPPHARG